MSESFWFFTEANIMCMVLMILMVLFVSRSGEKQDRRNMLLNTLIMMVISFIGDICYAYALEPASKLPEAAIYFGFMLFTFAKMGVGYQWFLYSEVTQGTNFVAKTRNKFICAIPMILTEMLVFSCPFTGFFIRVTVEGEHTQVEKSDMYGLYYGVMFGYLLITLVHAFIRGVREERTLEKRTYLSIAAFPIAIIIGGILQQSFFLSGFFCYGCLICVILTFIVTQESRISTDPLTRLNNRNQLNKYMLSEMRNPEINEHLYLMIFDIDKFKQINDKYGHIEGDRALVKMTDILKRAVRHQDYRNFVARFGGDEFIIVTEAWDEVKRIMKKIRELEDENNTKGEDPYELSISMGYAKYEKNMTGIQQWIDTADEMLYKEKKVKERERNISMR